MRHAPVARPPRFLNRILPRVACSSPLPQQRAQPPLQQAILASYYRGGTSRAVILQPQHLPKERAKWPAIFRQVMGSGDPYGRQLDGMGAGISSLSKICLVEPFVSTSVRAEDNTESQEEVEDTTAVPEADIDYTFVGLGIENNEVDVAGNCGNMSSAIGPYAYNARLLPPKLNVLQNGSITVRIRNTNTGKMIHSTFDVHCGQAAVIGDYTIDGVTGPGSKIGLAFNHPYGSKTGKVLPTGRRVDRIAGHNVSCIDGANPAVFLRASDLGVDGAILPHDFNKLPEKLALLERIRKAAAVAMGIAPTEDSVPRTIPKIGLVSQSSAHAVLSGKMLRASQMDIVIRFLSDMQPHRAIPLTAALTTAVAARIPGTIVEQLLTADPVLNDAITIGHASGRLQVNATMNETNPIIPVTATVFRTAKRLSEGKMFWTDSKAVEESSNKYGVGTGHSLGMQFVLESRGSGSPKLETETMKEKVELLGQQELLESSTQTRPEDVDIKSDELPPTDQDPILLAGQDPAFKTDNVSKSPADQDLVSPARQDSAVTAEFQMTTAALQQLHSSTENLLKTCSTTSRAFPPQLLWSVTKTGTKVAEHIRNQDREDIATTPLTRALLHLRRATRELLADRHLMTGDLSANLLKDVRRTNAKILENTKEPVPVPANSEREESNELQYMAKQIPGRRERLLKKGVRYIIRHGRPVRTKGGMS